MAMRRYAGVVTGPLGNRIIAFVERYYPKVAEVYVTSGMDGDHGPRPNGSHHYGLTYQGSPTAAIDFGGGGVTPEGSRRMRDLAKWWYDLFGDLLVEEVHTTPYSNDQGFYVKNQRKLPNGGGVYGTTTKEQHRNHVHIGTSAALMAKIEARAAAWQVPVPPQPAPSPVDLSLFIDVSHHDWDRLGHGVDWTKVVGQGLGAAALVRATYGDPQVFAPASPHFEETAAAAKAAGVRVVGGYHNLIKGDAASVARQVDFHRAALDKAGCHFGMCDVERYPELLTRNLAPDWDTVQRFNERWQAVEPDRVMAWYIARWVWGQWLGTPDLRVLVGPLINADYPVSTAAKPAPLYAAALASADGAKEARGWDPYGNRTPDVWQYSSKATVDGASSATDVNAFRGSPDALVALFTDDEAGPPPSGGGNSPGKVDVMWFVVREDGPHKDMAGWYGGGTYQGAPDLGTYEKWRKDAGSQDAPERLTTHDELESGMAIGIDVNKLVNAAGGGGAGQHTHTFDPAAGVSGPAVPEA